MRNTIRFAVGVCCILPCFAIACLSGCSSGGSGPGAAPATGHADGGASYLPAGSPADGIGAGMAGDRFDTIVENLVTSVADQPLSTFSIDVDTASYAKARMYLLENNALPPPGAVRIEEFVNYFPYDYPPPLGDHPFGIQVETAPSPWQSTNHLVRIAIKGKEIQRQRPPCNLVFLVDVSGSMDYDNKLPLVKRGLQLLASQLTEQDHVAIVVYAGAAGVVLPPISGDRRQEIIAALADLHAGGSTNGGQGIHLAYQLALENFHPQGVNRVLLCSDGDFNVGTTSTAALVQLAEEQANKGIYLSVLGFGLGNHNDAMLEELSNKANGNYSFVDSWPEARKVLGEQIDSTLVTIAKDVKIQVEFNPARVASYRLLGYENRRMAAEEFNDDQRDAGEIGAGHSVTAFYEVTLAGDSPAAGKTGPLRYQTERALSDAAHSGELLTVRVRYETPDSPESLLIEHPVSSALADFEETSSDFQFASAVAAFGMLLRGSAYSGEATYQSVRQVARHAIGHDPGGYRAEFLQLIDAADRLGG